MATWTVDAETNHPLDFRLVRNSVVTVFWRASLLDDTVSWLRSHDYHVADLGAGSWSSDAVMFDDVARALHFPDYFGRNLDALVDCMSDVASGEYGWDAEASTGLVLVLRAYDVFARADRRSAQLLLDIVADQARRAMLIGQRIICLVQSDDPGLAFEPVGAMPVAWNDAEWLDSERAR